MMPPGHADDTRPGGPAGRIPLLRSDDTGRWHSEAIDLRNETLWVAVPSSSWRQHIQFLKVRILEALAREFPSVRVREIRCVVGRGRAEREASGGDEKRQG